MKDIWRIIKLISFVGAIVWVIVIGGVYGGRMIGLLIVAALLMTYLVAKDIRKYKTGKTSWLKAGYSSLKKNISFLFS